jgi:cytochrome c oxidase cbb3-type subunit 3
MADEEHIDEFSGTATAGHEWDGIRELNTPLPRWWIWTFYATVLFAVIYWVLMPAWPGLTGYTRGILGYSSRAAIDASVFEAKQGMAGVRDRLAPGRAFRVRCWTRSPWSSPITSGAANPAASI